MPCRASQLLVQSGVRLGKLTPSYDWILFIVAVVCIGIAVWCGTL
jgi:hypothetical protein